MVLVRAFFLLSLTLVFLAGCGVESQSSASKIIVNGGGTTTDPDPIDPIDTNETNETKLVLSYSQPEDGQEGVKVDSSVVITFNNSLDSSTVDKTSFLFTKDGSEIAFSVEHSTNVITLKTDELMAYASTYSVTVNSSLKDTYGNSISATSMSFATESSSGVPVTPSVYDPNACGSVDYRAITDNSFLPASTFSQEFGIGLTSYYPQGYYAEASEVILFHPQSLENETESLADVLVITENFSFSFDKVWVQNSNRTFYVRSPVDADEAFECYRYEINSTDAADISSQYVLVHRDY